MCQLIRLLWLLNKVIWLWLLTIDTNNCYWPRLLTMVTDYIYWQLLLTRVIDYGYWIGHWQWILTKFIDYGNGKWILTTVMFSNITYYMYFIEYCYWLILFVATDYGWLCLLHSYSVSWRTCMWNSRALLAMKATCTQQNRKAEWMAWY